MRFLYTLLLYLLMPLILLRLLWRGLRAPDYRKRWGERFAFFARPSLSDKIYWVHAVSVGETLAAVPMIKAILANNQDISVVVTTTTPTGSAQVKSIFADQVFHVYAPYDLPDCVSRFIGKIRPVALIIMETELWPNTITQCHCKNIPVILANGRLSEKSAKGYTKISRLITPVLEKISLAAMQYPADAERMQVLGLRSENCQTIGNIKFDLEISASIKQQAENLRREINQHGERVVWIAASTHPGEDERVVEIFQKLKLKIPSLFLIVVPRHPERFNIVTQLFEEKNFIIQRRSVSKHIEKESQVLIADTMGELLMLYGAADFTFVGGSFVPVGGHNLMEPAAWALPIISGESVFNFLQASKMLQENKAMFVVNSDDELLSCVKELAENKTMREDMGSNAFTVAEKNRGALEKLLSSIDGVVAE